MKRLFCLLLYVWCSIASAHKPSDSYLTLTIDSNRVSGRWDIALRDLDFAIGLDNNGDSAITWGELRSKAAELSQYAFSRLKLNDANTACSHRETNLMIDEHTDGKYVVLIFESDCSLAPIGKLGVDYRLFAKLDPQHRGLLKLNQNNISKTAVLVPGEAARIFEISSGKQSGAELLDFISEGVRHIWIGFDHILFLFSLLIPSVMVYQWPRWRPAPSFKDALRDVVNVVTAFTLAHSITLSAAVLGYVELPSRWVESVIAVSVVLAALNNLIPLFTAKRALLAFAFGLIHGFGFAGVLAGLDLEDHSKLWSLLGFNLGVEIGQIALVLVFLPIAYKLSRYRFYQAVVLKSCSIGIAGLACVWVLERAFEISVRI